MEKTDLLEKLTGEKEPKFVTEREMVIVDKCLEIINKLETDISELKNSSAWKLPSGTYTVGVDKAKVNTNDYNSRVWMQLGLRGEIVIVAEEVSRQ